MKVAVSRIFKIIGWLLFIAFIGFSIYDGYMYDKVYKYYSAPFYLYILVRFIIFALPGIICLLISHFARESKKK